jgi:hypothetical protein
VQEKETIKEQTTTKEPKESQEEELSVTESTPSVEVLSQTLGAMPIDDLRRLLLGAEVNISIKFPKEF